MILLNMDTIGKLFLDDDGIEKLLIKITLLR